MLRKINRGSTEEISENWKGFPVGGGGPEPERENTRRILPFGGGRGNTKKI